MAYYGGQTAWQVFSPDEYRLLSWFFGKRIDYWDRERLVSFGLSMVLRHGKVPAGVDLQINKDGSVALAEIAAMRPFALLHTSVEELKRIVKAEKGDRQNKKRHELCSDVSPGDEGRVRAEGGHSDKIGRQIDWNQALRPAKPGDKGWRSVMLHGTSRTAVPSIDKTGLLVGGAKGASWRSHLHLVQGATWDRKREGVRSGSEVLVSVDVNKAYYAGARFFWSSENEGVLLTAGFEMEGLRGEKAMGLPRHYVLGFKDLYSGKEIVPQAVPSLDVAGRPSGSRLAMEFEVSNAVGKEIAGRGALVYTYRVDTTSRIHDFAPSWLHGCIS